MLCLANQPAAFAMEGHMKRLLILIIVGVAAWLAWKRGPNMFDKVPQHDVVVTNGGSSTIERLRVTVAGQTFVKETLPPGSEAIWQFRTQGDTGFQLVWEWGDRAGEMRWAGGRVAQGPLVQIHRLRIDKDGGVVYQAENKPTAVP